ncbi:Endonuclease/exonuclease/phosphatase [Minicystis rosea]|nr:Endonuclease/exonuclease/phosphatase [Minicystis rosea]
MLSRLRFSFAAIALSALLAACGGSSTTASSSSGTGGSAGGGTGGTGGVLPPPQRLSIMDWNVRNYFDTTQDGADEGVLSAADYNEKRAGIGAVIGSLAPDIVMLAEVENKFVLDDLNASVLGNAYVDTEIFDGNDPRGINVGMLSKVKPDKVVSHKDDAFTRNGTNGPSYHYARDCLEVHFTFNGRHMVVLGVHFKAKASPDDPDKRLAEAQHTRAIADAIMAEDPGAGVIILGDFNDTPGSPPVAAVAGAAPALFTDAADVVPTANRYSYEFNGTLELIDHQMANPLAAAMLDPATVVIKHGKAIDDGSKAGSDHSPIFAVYQVH